MTDFGTKATGDMLKSVYDADADGVVDSVPAHRSSHELYGADEMYPETGYPLTAHGPAHESGMPDEIDAAGLAGRINYVNRGDPSAWDVQTASFTCDDTWRDLDLSAIVPAGATVIHVYVYVRDDAVNSVFQLRKNGNSNNYNTLIARTLVANIAADIDGLIPCDSSRVLEYRGSAVPFTDILLLVKGWLI